MYEHNALGYWSGLALCLTKVRSSRARCPATALILNMKLSYVFRQTVYVMTEKELTEVATDILKQVNHSKNH